LHGTTQPKGDIFMKRFIILLLTIVLGLSLTACNMGGDTGTEGLEYRLLDDGTYELVGIGTATELDIVIPAKYDGKAVSAIGINAFKGCYNLKSIKISNGIKTISMGAFAECTSLTSITLPSSLESIGTGAFIGCDALTYNEYDNAKYLGNTKNPYLALVSAKSSEITSCEIKSDTKFICNNAFFLCAALTEIDIPDSVSYIGGAAFQGCFSLAELKLPKDITSISDACFSGCMSLKEISIPEKVSTVGANAFEGCTALESVNLPEGLSTLKFFAFANCQSLGGIYLPASLSSVEACVFYGCTALSEINCGGAAAGENWAVDWLDSCGATVNYGVKK